MKWWGGGNSKKENTTSAIVTMRAHLESLQKREVWLEGKRDEQDAVARKMVTSNKAAARAALRRKKQYETEIEKLQGQMISLEQQLAAVEGANLNYETMKVMQQGAAALKGIHNGMDMDKLDTTMDDIRDQVALNEEISDAISRPLQETDDAELEEELELLEQETVDAHMVAAGRAPAAPSAPLSAPETSVDEVEDEDEEEVLRQLQAEMAM